jgi:hypothetical protein
VALRFIVGAATLFMLLDSPGDTGGPRRYRGDNSPSDLVSQSLITGETATVDGQTQAAPLTPRHGTGLSLR